MREEVAASHVTRRRLVLDIAALDFAIFAPVINRNKACDACLRAIFKRSIESIASNCSRIALVLEAFNMCVRVRSALSIDSNHRRAQNLNAGRARCSASSFLFRGFKCCAPHPHSVRCIAIQDAANCTASRGLRWPHAPQRRPVAISRSCHCILARKLVTGQWLSILLVLVSSDLILLVHAILAHATQKPNAAT